MSFSISVPSIAIPKSSNSFINTNVYSNRKHSNVSSMGSTMGSTPLTAAGNISTSSPPSTTMNYRDKYADILSTPTSTSCTVNRKDSNSVSYIPVTTPNGQHEIIVNTPNTINAIVHNKSRHKRADYDKITTASASLAMSVTPMTPNPNCELEDVTFNFDIFDIMEEEKQKTTTDSKQEALTDEMNTNVLSTDIDDEISAEPPLNKDDKVDDDDDDDKVLMKDEDERSEKAALSKHGYHKIKKITETLQGCIFVAENRNFHENGHGHDDAVVVIKRTSKYLHNEGITIQDGKTYPVNENVLKEYDVLNMLSSAPNCPSQIAKSLDFFETEYNYYLVMQHGGADFFQFIVEAHQLIKQQKLAIKEWRKFVKYMFYQMVVTLQWLHCQMNCCHLDISLENLTVQNGNFILQPDGSYTVNPQIRIKFVDFGLAEFFDPNDGFQCVKYVGKTAYKCPEIYRARYVFDARKADIWSLGVVLFCMAVGSPPYVKPSNSDDAFKYYIKTGLIEKLLFQWNRHFCVTVKMLDLLKKMLTVSISKRYSVENVLKHSWLNVYHKQYKASRATQIRQNHSIFHHLTLYKLPTSVKRSRARSTSTSTHHQKK